MATSCTNQAHPFYKEIERKSFSSQDIYKFLTGEGKENLQHLSLGEALDFISFGGLNFVGYNLSTKDLVKFTRFWMKNQPPRIEYENVDGSIEEKKGTYPYLWNKPHLDYKEEIPRIDYDSCPKGGSHTEILKDLSGRLRCAHKTIHHYKPNFSEEYRFFDSFSGLPKITLFDNAPQDPTPDEWIDENGEEVDWGEEYEEFLVEKAKYEKEKEKEYADICYAIIKEPEDFYVPLHTVFSRLNCSHRDNFTINPFSGFTLANYAKAWFNQPGRKRVWKKGAGEDIYNAFPDFQAIGSDD